MEKIGGAKRTECLGKKEIKCFEEKADVFGIKEQLRHRNLICGFWRMIWWESVILMVVKSDSLSKSFLNG